VSADDPRIFLRNWLWVAADRGPSTARVARPPGPGSGIRRSWTGKRRGQTPAWALEGAQPGSWPRRRAGSWPEAVAVDGGMAGGRSAGRRESRAAMGGAARAEDDPRVGLRRRRVANLTGDRQICPDRSAKGSPSVTVRVSVGGGLPTETSERAEFRTARRLFEPRPRSRSRL